MKVGRKQIFWGHLEYVNLNSILKTYSAKREITTSIMQPPNVKLNMRTTKCETFNMVYEKLKVIHVT